MKKYFKNEINFAVLTLFLLCVLFGNISAQSNSQNFPTPVSTSEINGTIKARDIGDSRLTTYFYTFNGTQGDIFVNVVTNNFNGDIDVFAADGLKSLSKIVIYAEASNNETGRVIYLRKPEKILLRIEGRTPNDDPASFNIKFAGSFQAITDGNSQEEPKLPEIRTDSNTGIRVNSVGTIIETKPKTNPVSQRIAAEVAETKNVPKKPETKQDVESAGVVTQISIETEQESMVVAETVEQPKKNEETSTLEISVDETVEEVKTEKNKVEKKKETIKAENNKTAAAKPEKIKKPKPAKTEKIVEPNPLENIRLIVLFKDGTKIEKPMSEVLKMGVDKGILTVIAKDGNIGRYSILDVAKMTIE